MGAYYQCAGNVNNINTNKMNLAAVLMSCPAGALFYADLQCCVDVRQFPCKEHCIL